MVCVYILLCLANNTYYIGSTNDKERRLQEHVQGKSKYTKYLRPIKIALIQEYKTLKEARAIENRLKKLKSRRIIENIIKDGRIKLRA